LEAARKNKWPIVEVHEDYFRLAYDHEIVTREEFLSGDGAGRLNKYWKKYLDLSDRWDKFGILLFYSYDMYYFVREIPEKPGSYRWYTMWLEKDFYETGEGIKIPKGDITQVTEALPSEKQTRKTEDGEQGAPASSTNISEQGDEAEQKKGEKGDTSDIAMNTKTAPGEKSGTQPEKDDNLSNGYPSNFTVHYSSSSDFEDTSSEQQIEQGSEQQQQNTQNKKTQQEQTQDEQITQQGKQNKQKQIEQGSEQQQQNTQNKKTQQEQTQDEQITQQGKQNKQKEMEHGGSASMLGI